MKLNKVKVIIASPADDIHALAVQTRILELGQTCIIDDLSWEDDNDSLLGFLSHETSNFTWRENLLTADTRIWWRRCKLPKPSDKIDKQVSGFVSQEKRQGLLGMLHATCSKFFNDPFREARANLKPVQLSIARSLNLEIPSTCITNSAVEARTFLKQLKRDHKHCVFKAFTPSLYHMAETRRLEDQHLEQLDEFLRYSPVIFQELIPKKHDVRVFVAGEKCYSVECVTAHEELVDWRLDPLSSYEKFYCPEIEEQSRKVVSALGLTTGSLDFRITPSGQPIFLEINPSGQFLFMEPDVGHPVSQAMADLLIS